MSSASSLDAAADLRERKTALYARIFLLIVAASVICLAIVNYRGIQPVDDVSIPLVSQLVRALYSLLPYMISAVVATITLIAIGALVPAARNADPSAQLHHQMRMLAAGHLNSRMRVEGDKAFRELATEYNNAVSMLANQMAAMKIVNRRQWEALCAIREAVHSGDRVTANLYISEMEKNWGKIAEIENKLTT